jgi:hypothetical protein
MKMLPNTGALPDAVFLALRRSVDASDRFRMTDGVPTYSRGIEDIKTTCPEGVGIAMRIAHEAHESARVHEKGQ